MSTQGRIEIESHKDPAQLEREIEAKRAEIAGLVSALERRLSPGELVERALAHARGHGGELAANLGASVKANPVPMLLTGLGIAWLVLNQHRGAAYASGLSAAAGGQAHGGVRDRASQLRDRAAGTLGAARQRVGDGTRHAGDALHRAGDAAHRAGSAIRSRAGDARQGFEQLLQQQPLAAGAIGIAIGVLLGGLLPPTEREDALLGSAADRSREQARQLAANGLDRAGDRLAERDGDGSAAGPAGGNGGALGRVQRPANGGSPAPPF